MYHLERRAAENLTHADQRPERRRRRMDTDYQDQFRRRERERGDADMKQGINRVRTPSPPPQFNKFKARSYDRPWVQEVPAAKKPFPSTSGKKNASSDRRNSWNKGSVSRLPAISSRTQNQTAEQAMSSKTPRRADAPLASDRNKEQSPAHHNKDRPVAVKIRALKVSLRGKTNDQKDTPNGKKKTNTPQGCVGQADGSASPNPVRTVTLESNLLPQSLASSAPRCPLSAPGHGPPSSENGPFLQRVCDLSRSLSEDSSIGEDLQDADGGHFPDDTTAMSVPESFPSESPSGAGTPDSSQGDSLLTPLSDRLQRLDVLSSESEVEEDERGSALWQDTDRESYYTPASSAVTSPGRNAHRLHSLQPLSSQSNTSGISSRSGGYSRLPALVQIGQAGVTPLSPITGTDARRSVASPVLTGRLLPELAVDHRRRPPPSRMTSQRREEAAVPRTKICGRHSGPVSEQEEPEGAQARLLEESSDEEEADMCRICLSGARLSTDPLIAPCRCSGSLQFVHHNCLNKWVQTRIDSGSDLCDVETCELCKGNLTLDLDDFDLIDYYQRNCAQQMQLWLEQMWFTPTPLATFQTYLDVYITILADFPRDRRPRRSSTPETPPDA